MQVCCARVKLGAVSAPGWRNWQTQRTQNPPRATSWGFDPPSRHQDKLHQMNRLQRPKPLDPRGFFMLKNRWCHFWCHHVPDLLWSFQEANPMPRKKAVRKERGVFEK